MSQVRFFACGSKIIEYQLMKEEITNLNKKLYDECKAKQAEDIDITWNELAEKYGIVSGKILKDRWYRIKNKEFPELEDDSDIVKEGFVEQVDVIEEKKETPLNNKQTIEYNANGTTTSEKLIKIFEADSKNPIAVMIAHGLDPQEWQVVSYKNNMWNMPRKDDEPYVMLQSKITVKPLVMPSGIMMKDVDSFFKKLEEKNGVIEYKKVGEYVASKDGVVLEINLADLHVGNSPREKGLTIQEKVDLVVSDIIHRCGYITINKIILAQLGDIFHYDTHSRTTTGGTQIESGTGFPSMFDEGVELLISVIDRLSKIAPVDFVNIHGNHDRITSYTCGKALEFYYRNSKNVTIDSGSDDRKFRVIGKGLVYWVHGDMPKKNLTTLPQREIRQEYGNSKYCEIHSGHVHHESVIEADGVKVRFLPSLTTTDTWHYENGYTGALKSVVCFVWDAEKGIRDIWFSGVD